MYEHMGQGDDIAKVEAFKIIQAIWRHVTLYKPGLVLSAYIDELKVR